MNHLSKGFDRTQNAAKHALGLKALHFDELPPGDRETRYISTKVICLVIIVFWVLGNIFPSVIRHYFSLVPGNTFTGPYSHIWTLLTAGFIEPDFMTGLLNILSFALLGPLLERCYGSLLFVRFVLTINVVVYVAFFFGMILYFAMTEQDAELFRSESGFSAVNAALLVGLKQQYPNKELFPFSVPTGLRTSHLPFLSVALTGLLYFLDFRSNQFILILLGTYVGWFYLRFFMPDPVTQIAGDYTEDFAFATLFPNIPFLRRCIAVPSGLMSKICCPAATRTPHAPRPNTPLSYDNTNGGETEEPSFTLPDNNGVTKARRAIAMKSIDDRLAALQGAGDADIDGDMDIDIDIDLDGVILDDDDLGDLDINIDDIPLDDAKDVDLP